MRSRASIATASIHSAPRAVASKSNSLLWGVGQSGAPADAGRHDRAETAGQGAANLGAVRIGGVARVDIGLDDGVAVPERQWTRDDLGREHATIGEIGLNTRNLLEQFEGTFGLMRLDHQPPAVRQRDPGDTADARLMKQSTRHRCSEMANAERVNGASNGGGVIGAEHGKLDERRRGVPFAQMRGDDRAEMGNAVIHMSR
jgi:hypothetical protein